MNSLISRKAVRVISVIVLASMLFSDIAWSHPDLMAGSSHLAVPTQFQMGEDASRLFSSGANARGTIISILRYALGDPQAGVPALPREHMPVILARALGERAKAVDILNVTFRDDGTLLIPYEEEGKLYIAHAALKGTPQEQTIQGAATLDLSDRYAIAIDEVKLPKEAANMPPLQKPGASIGRATVTLLLAAAISIATGCGPMRGFDNANHIKGIVRDAQKYQPEDKRAQAIKKFLSHELWTKPKEPGSRVNHHSTARLYSFNLIQSIT